ncbi:HD domain-containing protein [Patescibacteria group bacterium]|nr:HD domain-containing protein [Patescibacteria group bacterium]
MEKDYSLKQFLSELGTKNERIVSAFKFAFKVHKNQYRKSGEPYVQHCLEVYKLLLNWGVKNEDLLISAILHDVLEDSSSTVNDLLGLFGEGVAYLVESVTELDIDNINNKDLETLRKIIRDSVINPRVAVLKIADRYHNLNTLQYMPGIKRQNKAKESLEVYAKLAESLGLWIIKTEIEDTSFKYLNFDRYSQVKSSIDRDSRLSEEEIGAISNILKQTLNNNKIDAKIDIKKSGYFHVFQKLKNNSFGEKFSNDSYAEINDVISYRVIVKSEKDCYITLHAIHKEMGSLIDYSRYDEFIGENRRTNGYEALQTTLNTEYGSVEIAIVTEDMENFNNWGYINNLRQGNNYTSYNLILVFTPESDLVFLPEGARAIDFAYAVNKRLGDNSTSSVINEEIQPLESKINNADIIKIITGKRTIDQDEALLNTSLPITKNLIRNKIIETRRKGFIKQGRDILENHLSPRGIMDLNDLTSNVEDISYSLGCGGIEEIYYRVSKGYLNLEKLDNVLNYYGVTKTKLGLTTILVRGKDKPGILNFITDCIRKNGGNIIKIIYEKDNLKSYYLRVVCEGISYPKGISKLQDLLCNNKNLDDIKVI